MTELFKKTSTLRIGHAKSVEDIASQILLYLDTHGRQTGKQLGWTTDVEHKCIPYCNVYDRDLSSLSYFTVYLPLADAVTTNESGLVFIVENKASEPAELVQAVQQVRKDFSSKYRKSK